MARLTQHTCLTPCLSQHKDSVWHPRSCGPPFSHSNSSSLPDPHVDEIHGGKLKFAASWAAAEGWGWGNQPQINILFILPLKPTSQEPACSFPFSIYTFQKTMISY